MSTFGHHPTVRIALNKFYKQQQLMERLPPLYSSEEEIF